MTGTPGSLVTTRDDIQPIAWDLATVSGALSEIATTWRRARASRPDLPPGLPQRLADTAQHLAADALLIGGNGRGEAQVMPASLARQVSALREDVAAARAWAMLRSGSPSALLSHPEHKKTMPNARMVTVAWRGTRVRVPV